MEILLLCDRAERIAATVLQHLDALVAFSNHHVRALPMLGQLPAKLDLDRFDAVVIHYSLPVVEHYCIGPEARERIAAFKGLKAVFLQDEYRHVNKTIATLQGLGIDVLFTCLPDGEIEKVYSPAALPGLRAVNVLTGYVDESMLGLSVPKLADRPIDVGYRSRKVPSWLGDLGQEKWHIADRFKRDAAQYGLTTDISIFEEDRIYGPAWIQFMCRTRAMLGVESGASVFDFTGDIQQRVDALEAERPDIAYDEVKRLCFPDADGLIHLNQISPRCFEAAALRTLMIMYPGDYSGRLEPWRHYVPLAKDHSNMAEAVAVLKDPAHAQEIVDRAFEEVARNPANSFRALAAIFDQAMTAAFEASAALAAQPYGDAEFARASAPPLATRRLRLQRDFLIGLNHALQRRVFGRLEDQARVLWRRRLGVVTKFIGTKLGMR